MEDKVIDTIVQENKETPLFPVEKVNTVIAQTVNRDLERQRKWYLSGRSARKKGLSDTSPFYENATADYFFKCGYDGVSFEEAQKVLTEKIEQLFNTSPDVQEAVNELKQSS